MRFLPNKLAASPVHYAEGRHAPTAPLSYLVKLSPGSSAFALVSRSSKASAANLNAPRSRLEGFICVELVDMIRTPGTNSSLAIHTLRREVARLERYTDDYAPVMPGM